ncbi:MAG: hypothetical protein NZ604_06555 [Flavobacteriales bacterium]|nr:hypothetical protein [Flavobacteriales bacterium]
MDFKHKFEVETGQGIYSGEGQIIVNGTYNDAYVDWLEQQLHLARVSQQRELLIEAFDLINVHDGDRKKIAKLVDITLKSINCG